MKKILALSLLGVTLTGILATGTTVFADTFTGVSKGDTKFVGELGQFDPETNDPNNNQPPAGDQGWVKVELPTNIAYWSTAASNHKTITSGTYTIKNLSNYPVKATLSEFKGDSVATPDITDVQNLKLNKQALVTNGVAETTFVLGEKLGAGGKIPATSSSFTNASTWNLAVTGETAPSLTGKTKQTVLKNKLTFSFQALDADGKEVTPAP